MYNDMACDASLHVVANQAGAQRCEVIAVYLMLLDCANKNRGLTGTFEQDEAAVTLAIDVSTVANIVEALTKRKKIDRETGRIIGWDRLQHSSTERVRRSRAKRAQLHVAPQRPPSLTPAQISMQQRRLQQQNHSIIDRIK